MHDAPPSAADMLGLFAMPAVLLPGAALDLKVVEPRYLDLVRECGRAGRGFGVCLILEGEGEGAAAVPAAYGVEARIEDFGTADAGLLTLHVRGARRFRTRRVRVRDNGLQVAEVSWCDPDPDEPLRPEHGLLATVLERVIDHVGGDHAHAARACFDDAAWVGWRLAELLPLTDLQRQELLQLDDPHERLDRLLALMPE